MRWLFIPILIAPLVSGCGLLERFDSTEDRINAAVPPNGSVQAAHQRLLAQTADQPDVQRALKPLWAARLRLRALSCSPDYTPRWIDSSADIRARLADNDCFGERDRLLQRWLGLQRVRLLLAQGPVRPAPATLPPMISHREFISAMVLAQDAPVAILRGNSGFDIVALADGKSLFRDSVTARHQGSLSLSPNGHLFSHATEGQVTIRATEGGETLVELAQANGLLWLDDEVVALRSPRTSSLALLDLATGDDTPVPGTGTAFGYLAVRAAGAPNHFNLLLPQGAAQIEIVKTGSRREARLIAERRSTSGRGFAANTGGPSADGTVWIDAHQGLRVLNLETLALEEISFDPVGTQAAWPTPDPQEFLVAMHLPTGDGITSHTQHHLYNHRAGTLAQVAREPGSSGRYQYIASIRRLALIDQQQVRYIDRLPAAAPQPVATVVAKFIDEMNQRRLAAAVSEASPMAGTGAGATTLLQLQLRGAQVEGVGVYEGRGARHGHGQARAPGTVEVRVRRSARPIALVLSSYEPVRWTIVQEPGASVAAVLLSGYHESTVTGAGAARVYQIGQGYAYGQASPGYGDLQRSVARWTGKPMAVFQGRYEGSSFSVGGGP
jgi:hypothetical protein